MILSINNVSKTFNNFEVLTNCSLEIEQQSIYGLVGKNGVGKTTLLKIILGLLKSDLGTINILNKASVIENQKLLKEIGCLIETPIFYEHLNAQENLKIHLLYMGMVPNDEIIERTISKVGLRNTGQKKVSKFSLGMRQRLAIARAIIHNPKILILDEPLNGLDPKAIYEVRDLLLQLKNELQMTIIISSHIIHELQQVADKIGVLSDGYIVREIDFKESKIPLSDLEAMLLQYF